MLSFARLIPVACLLLSCGPTDPVVLQCVDQCLAAAGCPDASGGCVDICEEEREFSTYIDCKVEYETMLDCLDTATDECNQFGDCPVEVSTYFTCYGDFCTANPDDGQCAGIEQGGGAQ